MYATMSKGTGLLDCMRQNLKDQWVTVAEVRNSCDRGGGYTRNILEEASSFGLVERKEESEPRIYYRIDPPPGLSHPICAFQPSVPYEHSICYPIEKFIEENARARYLFASSDSFPSHFPNMKHSDSDLTHCYADSTAIKGSFKLVVPKATS